MPPSSAPTPPRRTRRTALLPLAAPALLLLAALLLAPGSPGPATGQNAGPAADAGHLPAFHTTRLTANFYAEGSAVGDLNGNGHNDIIAGPWVWFGPDFEQRAEIYQPNPLPINTYSENFLCFTHDINGDGRLDVLIIQHPGREAIWLENPGHFDHHWTSRVALAQVDNESPAFTDLTGDGTPDLVCSQDGVFGFATPDPDQPDEPWTFRPVTGPGATGGRYTHGLGVGDITGNGRMDLVAKNGWWEQPESLDGDPGWNFHPFNFAERGGAQMLVADFTGNGLSDVVTSLDAHGWGLALFRQQRGDDGGITFERQDIIGESMRHHPHGVAFSQLHGLAAADINGDGVPDIVTGKRFWAHNGNDPGALQPPVLYWFETVRQPDGDQVRFIPHRIHDRSGVGCEITVADITGNGLPDIVSANKRGVHVHLQQTPPDAAAAPALRPLRAPVLTESAQGRPPEQAAAAFTAYEDFHVQLVASEPDVRQPIAMTIDERGRLWIAEAYEYPLRADGDHGRDRILIFEDSNNDGRHDRRTVFYEGLNLVSGLEVGFGGAWVGAAPYLMFIPIADDGESPAGDPEILLDGWGWQDTHETLNAFIWGPDGWLYGCHGVFTHSRVGKPGTPDEERLPINAGVWRYHPVDHRFEIFAHGTSNPWGVDFDDRGQAFITACVIPHLYHVVQGARYQRQAGQHFDPHTYDDLKTIADHRHYASGFDGPHAATAASSDAGGGHAHCGLSIYLGDNFPPRFRGALLFHNLHGHRINHNIAEPRGSGFTGRGMPDFAFSNDDHHIGVALRYGPDGGLYFTDWHDRQICHNTNPEIWNRETGRVFKVTHGRPAPVSTDLGALTDIELAALTHHQNDWFVRTARRILQHRAASGDLDRQAVAALREQLDQPGNAPVPADVDGRYLDPDDWRESRQLRALWALHAIGALDEPQLLALTQAATPHLRAWAIQLLGQDHTPSEEALDQLHALAADPAQSPVVRLYLASLLQRLPLEARAPIATALLQHAGDAGDHNLPLMYWYGVSPLAAEQPPRALDLAKSSRIPVVRDFTLRRLAEQPHGRELIAASVAAGDPGDEAHQQWAAAAIGAFDAALADTRRADPPDSWQQALTHFEQLPGDTPRQQLDRVETRFGSARMQDRFLATVSDPDAEPGARLAALENLRHLIPGDQTEPPEWLPALAARHQDPLQADLIRALAGFPSEQTDQLLAGWLPDLQPQPREAAIQTLAATRHGGRTLLRALADDNLQRDHISAFTARQLRGHDDDDINQLLTSHWGQVRAGEGRDLRQAIEHHRRRFTTDALAQADLRNGRLVYQATCYACHTLFGDGFEVGPDITGSHRTDLDYLLTHLIDPSATVGIDYQLHIITTRDGRIASGMLRRDTADSITLVLTGGLETTVHKEDIEDHQISPQSMMPEGLLDNLTDAQARDLIAYLQSPRQVPLPDPDETIVDATEMRPANEPRGQVSTQAMNSFTADRWLNQRQRWWTGARPGDSWELDFTAPAAGQHHLFAVFTKAHDYAIVRVDLNGRTVIDQLDLYRRPEVVTTGELDLGSHPLNEGDNRLSIHITGAHTDATPLHMVGLDYLRLTPAAD